MDRKALVGFRQRLRGTALYRLSAAKERLCAGCRKKAIQSLLYVGVARNPLGRLAAHGNAEWAADVTQIQIDWHPTRSSAFQAAVSAIAEEQPYYNVEKRYPPRRGGQFTDTAAAVYRLSCNPEPLCRACRDRMEASCVHLGVSETPLVHIYMHRRKKWARAVTHITVDYHASRREALQAEAIPRRVRLGTLPRR